MEEAYSVTGIRRKASGTLRIPDENCHIFLIPGRPTAALTDGIVKDFGMLDLLDIFVEADRLVDFTRFFTHSGTKQVRSREALRPLLILDLFAEGTNMGIKRMANSNDR